MINQDPIYRFEDLDDDGGQYLTKTQIIPLDSVDISQDYSGEITVTPKHVPTVDRGNGKYRLEPEGDMFRLYATRNIRDNVNVGDRGGLVGDNRVLCAEGGCWIWDGSTAGRGCRVKGEAAVMSGCHLGENVTVGGFALLQHVEVTGGVQIDGSAWVIDSRISSGNNVLTIRGYSHISSSIVETDEELLISGCNINDAHIRNSYELLSVHQNNWGWLSAYRNNGGDMQFTIGCRTRHSVADLKYMADGTSGVSTLEREMLDHFLAMVEVSRRGWVDYVPPAEDPKSGVSQVAGADAPDVAGNEVPVMQDFSEMAQRARDAVWAMNPPPVVRPAQMDQYGYFHEGQ
jgi:carbonic anhydrase/acetyltransferase-like protein (isoleucine patch superfamily)